MSLNMLLQLHRRPKADADALPTDMLVSPLPKLMEFQHVCVQRGNISEAPRAVVAPLNLLILVEQPLMQALHARRLKPRTARCTPQATRAGGRAPRVRGGGARVAQKRRGRGKSRAAAGARWRRVKGGAEDGRDGCGRRGWRRHSRGGRVGGGRVYRGDGVVEDGRGGGRRVCVHGCG